MSETDDLLKRIQRARDVQDKIDYADKKANSESRLTRMSEDATMFHRFALQFMIAVHWMWGNVVWPTWRVVRWPFWKLFKQYRRLWSLVVYQRDEFENLRFSKIRAGIMLTSTIVFLWFVMIPMTFLIGETISYGLTAKKNEIVYLHNSQEIDPIENTHSVQGATRLPLNEDDSFYFRVDSTLFNHLWSIYHKGNIFYTDYVAAAIPPGVNRCTITSYGFRLKLLMRRLEVYPHLLSASCQPVNTEADK